jgi:hypothetical protein
MKKALKAIGWIASLLLLVFGILVGINAVDEDLSPESLKLLGEATSAIKDEDNAYFALWGMTAAEGADPHAVGKRTAAKLAARQAGPDPVVPVEAYGDEIRKLKASPAIGKLCDWAKEGCYAKLAAAVDRADALAQENGTLLARYAALGRYKGYSDTTPPNVLTPLPPLLDVTTMATLDLLLAIAEVKRGDAAAGMKRIGSGVSTARALIASSGQLLPRMVFANVLHRHAIVVAGLAAEYPEAVAAERERLGLWLAPLTPAERSLVPTFGYEFAGMHTLFAELVRQPRLWAVFGEQSSIPEWLRMRFVQPNATSNLLAGMMSEEQRLAGLPADKLAGELPGLEQGRAAQKASLESFSLRNPAGRVLASDAAMDMAGYVLRMHDLDAHLRLVALAVEIRARKLEPQAIAGFVASASAPAVDPYTGKPFQWDADKRELSTASRAKGQRHAHGGRFVVKL